MKNLWGEKLSVSRDKKFLTISQDRQSIDKRFEVLI